jgi:glycosyltransferase involved in cell wall biosynthesis
VLHCIPGMGGGGGERQLAYMSAPLTALGWDIHVALTRGGPNLPRLAAGGAVIHELRTGHTHDPRLVLQLWRLIRTIRPDLVQVWFVQMDLVAGSLAVLMRVPLIISERSSVLAYPRSLKNELRVAIGSRADAVIANSAGGEQYWRARAPHGPRRFVVPNAIPLDEIAGAEPSLPAGVPVRAGDFLVAFAGRFGAEKNVNVLLSVLPQMVAEDPGLRAVLCGDGPLRPEIIQQLREPALADRVFAPGYVPELWPLLKRADVLVAPSHFEGSPNSVLEAMAAGCPLIVSDIPAHREILDETCALWIDPSNPASVRAAILDVKRDAAAAAARAARARARVAANSLAAVAGMYDRLYRAILAGTRAVDTA